MVRPELHVFGQLKTKCLLLRKNNSAVFGEASPIFVCAEEGSYPPTCCGRRGDQMAERNVKDEYLVQVQ